MTLNYALETKSHVFHIFQSHTHLGNGWTLNSERTLFFFTLKKYLVLVENWLFSFVSGRIPSTSIFRQPWSWANFISAAGSTHPFIPIHAPFGLGKHFEPFHGRKFKEQRGKEQADVGYDKNVSTSLLFNFLCVAAGCRKTSWRWWKEE